MRRQKNGFAMLLTLECLMLSDAKRQRLIVVHTMIDCSPIHGHVEQPHTLECLSVSDAKRQRRIGVHTMIECSPIRGHVEQPHVRLLRRPQGAQAA